MNQIENEIQEARNKAYEAVLRVAVSMITAFVVAIMTIKFFG
jgi:hypothetical protein